MFVLCCKNTVVDRKRHEKDEKGLIQNNNGSKGKTQELIKKNPTGGMDVCVVFVVRTVVWNVK
jgi:hypothetical protein